MSLHIDWVHFWSVPIFTAIIGWLINWTGLWMLFAPIRFHGWHVPGLRGLALRMPRKFQEIPGWLRGDLGWQGIVPARAAKMGSIAVDRALAKMATASDFYQHLDPELIAEHIVTAFRPELPTLVDEIMWQEHPRLWGDLPEPLRNAVISRVQKQLPAVVRNVTDEIGTHIDQLIDPKIMVIDNFEKNPEIVVRIFKEFGARELRLMVLFGAIFGKMPKEKMSRTYGAGDASSPAPSRPPLGQARHPGAHSCLYDGNRVPGNAGGGLGGAAAIVQA